jgi:hypothetical protein
MAWGRAFSTGFSGPSGKITSGYTIEYRLKRDLLKG